MIFTAPMWPVEKCVSHLTRHWYAPPVRLHRQDEPCCHAAPRQLKDDYEDYCDPFAPYCHFEEANAD